MPFFNVTVTEKHLSSGTPDDPLECPLCWALRDLFGKAARIEVTREEVCINGMPYPMTPAILAFIQIVDAGIRPVVPLTLRIGR